MFFPYFSKIKSPKEVTKQLEKVFLPFLLDDRKIPLTNRSGSGRPKNMWIWWIRIRNTGICYNYLLS
jgi:hypothetical protein